MSCYHCLPVAGWVCTWPDAKVVKFSKLNISVIRRRRTILTESHDLRLTRWWPPTRWSMLTMLLTTLTKMVWRLRPRPRKPDFGFWLIWQVLNWMEALSWHYPIYYTSRLWLLGRNCNLTGLDEETSQSSQRFQKNLFVDFEFWRVWRTACWLVVCFSFFPSLLAVA